MKLSVRAALAALLIAVFGIGVATPALAAGPASGNPAMVVLDTGGACSQQGGSSSNLLTINRWGSNTGNLHSRLTGSNIIEQADTVIKRTQSSAQMSIGNSAFSLASSMVEGAAQFCLLDLVGGTIDKFAATLGKALIDSPLFAVAFGIAVFGLVWARMRQTNTVTVGNLIKKVAVIGLLGLMVAGATRSTTVNGVFTPGAGSPGWFVVKTDRIISSIASAPVAAIASAAAGDADLNTATTSDGGVMSCQRYIAALREQYRNSYGSGVGAAAATTPLLVSSLWEQSGYAAWKKTQFGTDPGAFADYASCRYLELKSGIPMWWNVNEVKVDNSIDSMADVQAKASGVDRSLLQDKYTAAAWWTTLSDADMDKAIIGWAACKLDNPADYNKESGWSVQPGGENLFRTDSRTDMGKACYTLFNADATSNVAAVLAPWDWSGDASTTRVDSGNTQASNFILAWQGTGTTDQVAGVAYIISGLAILVVFGLLAGGICVAKLAALVFMAMLFLTMTMAVLTNQEDKAIGFAKQYIGISLFSWLAQLVISLIAVFSAAMVKVTAVLPGGPGGILAMIWVGIAPLLSVWIIGRMLKSAGLPSPFSITGALAMGSAFTARGAGAGADGMLGLGAMASSGLGAARLGRGATGLKRGARSMASKIPGLGRFSKLAPDGGGAGSMLKTAAATAAGAGAALAIDNVADAKREQRSRRAVDERSPHKESKKESRRKDDFDKWVKSTGQSTTRAGDWWNDRSAARRVQRDEDRQTRSARQTKLADDLKLASQRFRDKPMQARLARTELKAQAGLEAAGGAARKVWDSAGKVVKAGGGSALGLGAAFVVAGAPGLAVAGGVVAARKVMTARRNAHERSEMLQDRHTQQLAEGYAAHVKEQRQARKAARETEVIPARVPVRVPTVPPAVPGSTAAAKQRVARALQHTSEGRKPASNGRNTPSEKG